jgi:hypothetical protein
MKKLLKFFAWLSLVAAIVMCVFLAVLAFSGDAYVTINGQQVEGAQKLIIGSIGFLMAGVATLVAIGIGALAVSGISLILFIILAFMAFVLVSIALPFLLPILIPVVVISMIFINSRNHKIKKGA